MRDAKKTARVSVVIVNWNGRKWLERCLDSLRSQTYPSLEVIVVDNASTDDSVSFITRHYPEVMIVGEPANQGFATGVNAGLRQARGELILLLNNDAWVGSDFLKKLVRSYQLGKYDVVAPQELDYDGKGQPVTRTVIDPLGHPVWSRTPVATSGSSFYLQGVCLLFSKELYIETGGLDNDFFMYFEETDWFWRLNLMGKRFGYVDGLYIYHAGAGSTGSGIKYLSFLWRNQNTLQMLLKNYRAMTLLWVLPLYILQNLAEIVAFLVLMKPKIALSYIQGWWFVIKNFKKVMAKRAIVQHNRVCNDRTILTRMYLGSGKLRHLINFYHHEP